MNFYLSMMLCLVSSFLISWFLVAYFQRLFLNRGVVDVPNKRSSHTSPVPRSGGLGLILGAMAGLMLTSFIYRIPFPRLELLGAALLIGAVGLIDDIKKGLSPYVRLVLQIGVASIFVYLIGPILYLTLPRIVTINLSWMAGPITILWLVSVVNIYNFMDGIDGLAGIQAFVTALFLAIATLSAGESLLAIAIAGATVGFLLYNWHPAKIFLGDVGSTFLGFVFAGIPLSIARSNEYKVGLIWFVSMSLWFFLSDGVFTIIRRALKKENIWQAHRSHIYQRMVKAGVSHSTVALSIGFASALISSIALFSIRIKSPWAIVAVMLIALVSFFVYWRLAVTLENKYKEKISIVKTS